MHKCQLGTALPELVGLPFWAAARDSIVAAAQHLESTAYPPNPGLAAPCGGVSNPDSSATPWSKRGADGFAASASSKRSGTKHVWHTHIRGTISGVFYVSTPPGSGRIVFDDGTERVAFRPRPGDIIVFPSWLPHMVPPFTFPQEPEHLRALALQAAGRVTRVSISFDLKGTWRWRGAT